MFVANLLNGLFNLLMAPFGDLRWVALAVIVARKATSGYWEVLILSPSPFSAPRRAAGWAMTKNPPPRRRIDSYKYRGKLVHGG